MKKIVLLKEWDRFIELINEYLSKNKMTQQQLANLVGMQRSHLSAILNKSPHRPFSAHYLIKFIESGIISVNHIKQDDPTTDSRAIEFWNKAREIEERFVLRFKWIRYVQRVAGITGDWGNWSTEDVKKLYMILLLGSPHYIENVEMMGTNE